MKERDRALISLSEKVWRAMMRKKVDETFSRIHVNPTDTALTLYALYCLSETATSQKLAGKVVDFFYDAQDHVLTYTIKEK